MNRPVYNTVPTDLSKSNYVAYTAGQSGSAVDPDQVPDRTRRMALQVLTVTLLIAGVIAVPYIPWIWYIAYKERTVIDRPGLSLLSTANATQLILISTVSVTISKFIVGPLMGLYAYVGAVRWLQDSEMARDDRLPTPTQ